MWIVDILIESFVFRHILTLFTLFINTCVESDPVRPQTYT